MKKLISILLILAVMLLGVVASYADDGASSEPELLALADPVQVPIADATFSYWFAIVSPVQGMEFEAIGCEDAYAAVTFFANKPFSNIQLPFWAGNPNTFIGIVPGELELCLFKAIEGNCGEDYDTETALRKEIITTDHDALDFVWNFEQVPGGRYCFRIRLLTEEGAYVVLNDATLNDVDAEFEIVGTNNTPGVSGEAFVCYIVLDEGEEVTPEPKATPAPTEPPTEPPVEDPTEASVDDPTAEPADTATNAPADDATAEPAGKTEPKKGCGGIFVSGLSVIALAAAAFVLRKKSR